jgi:hypothetical protein
MPLLETQNMKKSHLMILLLIFTLFTVFAIFVIYVSSGIPTYSLDKLASFGDSFGVLTSLFSGLAFAGMIITILLQKDELQLQRDELARTSSAQEINVKLSALTALLSEYKSDAQIFSDALEDGTVENEGLSRDGMEQSMSDSYEKQYAAVREIEKILTSAGINLKA